MKKMLLVLFVVTFIFPVFGQQYLEGTSVNRGNIFTTDSKVIEGQYIVFSKDSIEYYLENSQDRYVLPLDQVNEVLEYDGNYSNTGIWIGGIAGAAIGTAIAIGSEETTTTAFYTETTIQLWPILVFTAVGTLAGWLIGSQVDGWNTVYSKSAAFLKSFNIKQNNHSGLDVSYRVYF
jgi:hypothetical protein